jgi:uncharacterized NAD-dependent epimerase/dehydratase family protein
MDGSAIILTNGKLSTLDGKTAHGLIRGTSRFKILGVIDHVHAGKDAGEVIDNESKSIPIYATLKDFLDKGPEKPDFCVVGVAMAGGILPEDFREILFEVIENRISIISGLHHHLGDDPDFKKSAQQYTVDLIDIRNPRPVSELSFWSGEIYQVKSPRIAVLGIDCAVGKRTTCRFLMERCRAEGIKTEMIYTGQTGWLQGYKYGFILDATPNDFVGGEIERAIVECDREASPDLILLEGQSSLRNPSGPCGAEFILSGNTPGIILQHAPFRKYFDELESAGCLLPSVEDEIDLIKKYGARTLAVTLNGSGGTSGELAEYQTMLADKLQIPVVRPLEEGVESLIPVIREYIDELGKRQ